MKTEWNSLGILRLLEPWRGRACSEHRDSPLKKECPSSRWACKCNNLTWTMEEQTSWTFLRIFRKLSSSSVFRQFHRSPSAAPRSSSSEKDENIEVTIIFRLTWASFSFDKAKRRRRNHIRTYILRREWRKHNYLEYLEKQRKEIVCIWKRREIACESEKNSRASVHYSTSLLTFSRVSYTSEGLERTITKLEGTQERRGHKRQHHQFQFEVTRSLCLRHCHSRTIFSKDGY